jgi:D-beta-D-heptose 7-phosphate kinase/D-beta-D-heptose 1-phosphate adenosyltransferase
MRPMNIIVVGDSMLDRYYEGAVTRISPEASCPVVDVDDIYDVPGGAANVAMNLAALGVKCDLVTVLGGDEHDSGAEKLRDWFGDESKISLWTYHLKEYQTPIKTRICSTDGRQLLRYDVQDNRPFNDARATSAVFNKVSDLLLKAVQGDKPSALVLSDYGKGVLRDPQMVHALLEMAQISGVPTIVDPKGKNFDKYRAAYLLKPNLKEARRVTRGEGPEECAVQLMRQYRTTMRGVLVTAGRDGMVLAHARGDAIVPEQVPAFPPHTFCNSCGAGDTVTAILATQIACRPDEYDFAWYRFRMAAKMASIGASAVVTKPGTAVLHEWEYEAALSEQCVTPPLKSVDLETAVAVIETSKTYGEEVVFVNGCFDGLHPGHLHLLQEARRMGDTLVVAVNSDESVKRLKGDKRPLIPCEHRVKMLEALQCVDLVIVFDEDTPEKVIKAVKPDLLVKGEEYYSEDLSTIPGAEFVVENGRGVLFVSMLKGYSTTKLEEKAQDG